MLSNSKQLTYSLYKQKDCCQLLHITVHVAKSAIQRYWFIHSHTNHINQTEYSQFKITLFCYMTQYLQ